MNIHNKTNMLESPTRNKLDFKKKNEDENGLPCKAVTEINLNYDDNLVLIMGDLYQKEGKTRKNVDNYNLVKFIRIV